MQDYCELIEAADQVLQNGVSALPSLFKAAQDPDTETRWRALVVMGWIGDKQSIPYLVAALSDGEWAVRHSALWALGMIRDAGVIELLMNVLRAPDSEEQVRYVTAMGLVNQRDQATEHLLRECAHAEDDKIRRPANAALINPQFRAD